MTSLVVKGSIKLVIEDRVMKAEDGAKFFVEQVGGELHVRPAESNNATIVYNGGSSYMMNNYSNGVSMMNGNMMINGDMMYNGRSSYVVNNCSNGVSIINGDIHINASTFNNKVVINGKDFGNVIREEIRLQKLGKSLLDDINAIQTENKQEEKEDGSITSYNLTKTVDRVHLLGDGMLDFKTSTALLSIVSVDIAGSGQVLFPGGQLNGLTVKISGSGSFDGRKVKIDNGSFFVTGSGHIENCHCLKTCNAEITGSGSIKCSAEPHCSTDRRLTGSGKITIKK